MVVQPAASPTFSSDSPPSSPRTHEETAFAALLALALAVPAGLAAQRPTMASPPNPITMTFEGRTMFLQRTLAQAFDSIPERLFSYRPTPAQQTIGYIAQHLANDNYYFCNAFGEMKAAQAMEDTATADSIKATWPKERLMARLNASFAFCENAFAQLDDAKLGEVVNLTSNGRFLGMIRAAMVLGHLQDMTDHYSQLANYMRLNNIVPPTALPRRPPRP